jgi:hypothetical protein
MLYAYWSIIQWGSVVFNSFREDKNFSRFPLRRKIIKLKLSIKYICNKFEN